METRIFMVPPLKQEFLAHDALPPTRYASEIMRTVAESIFKAPFIWIGALMETFALIQNSTARSSANLTNRNKKEIRDNHNYNYGWASSLREQWSIGSQYERYFQMMDKEFHIKAMKDALLSSLLQSLEKRNISVEDFKEASTRIFNEGIIVTGGSVSADSVAAGRGAASKVKKVFGPSNPADKNNG